MWLPIASTLIDGKRDAILVDAFLTVEPVGAMVDGVAASGKNLTTIDATHGHGDHAGEGRVPPQGLSGATASARAAVEGGGLAVTAW
jgi:glyoxylase-like metal-dependent hydrolase (beta-lactamase superfamily II)